ncbi:MAG: ABC transporter substrate-binding protein, partial [Deltaproteobacteria bacterium]|nr:ABC transporter substrate-binding protein [Deltaproteobacteria bacterium]
FDGVNYQIGDYKIELVWIDSQSDPAKGSNAYTEAIEKQGIGASFANWHSSVAMAMMDICAQYKIPHIPGLGASSMITDKFNGDRAKFNGYYLKSWPNPEKMFQGYIDFVDEIVKSGKWKPKSKKIALFAEDTDWGHSAMAAFKKGFGSSGQWEIVSEDLFPATQTDFYQMLGRYKSQDVALIAGVTTYPAMGALVKQADETKLGALIISDRLSEVGNWYEVTGKSSNYLLDMMPTLSTEQAKAWFNTVKEKYNISPSPVAGGLSHDSAKLLIKVMKRANEKYGELTSEGIANVVRDEVVPGTLTLTAADGAVIMKEYKYTEETAPDPLVGPDYYFFPIVQCMDGQALVVYPEYAKQTDFQLPK